MAAPPAPTIVEFQADDGALLRVDAAPASDLDATVAITATAPDGRIWVHTDGATTALRPLTRRQAADLRLAQREREAGVADPEQRAPMPGAVVAVHVTDGQQVDAGDRLLAIEAMKMEHPVTAPHAGIVHVLVAVGDQVARDQVLARVEPAASDDAEAPL